MDNVLCNVQFQENPKQDEAQYTTEHEETMTSDVSWCNEEICETSSITLEADEEGPKSRAEDEGGTTEANQDGIRASQSTTAYYKAKRPDTLQALTPSQSRKIIVPKKTDRIIDGALNQTPSTHDGGHQPRVDSDIALQIFLDGLSLENELTPDDLKTPDILNQSMFDGELSTSGTPSNDRPLHRYVEPIPVLTAREEFDDQWSWRTVIVGGQEYEIDMKAIEPYKRVLSHGGYYGDLNAIIVFSSCYLPTSQTRNYAYIMENLFLYVISVLQLLVVDDYMILYFHAATSHRKMPNLQWLKRCYDMIDRKLKKNLKRLIVIHPTMLLRACILMMKPFLSAKFWKKLHYIKKLSHLDQCIPTDQLAIPVEVKRYDALKYSPAQTDLCLTAL